MLKNTKSNLKSTSHTRPDRVSRGMIFNNKEYHTAGFPLALRLAGMTEERGRSTPTCHPWTSVSEIHASMEGNCPVDNLIWGAMRHKEPNSSAGELMSELKSTWRGLNAPHFTRFAQSGRSMVEMLGVLAVMGVLCVAGIAGYNSAMNRHRANELLSEASKRAAIVASQAMQGRETFSIAEFGTENTRLNFSETVDYDTANKQFTLTITGVTEAVCYQMNNAKGPVIRKFEPATCSGDNNTVKLTFNDDMSPTPKASDFNGNKTACEADSSRQYCASNDTCISATDTCPSTVECGGHGYKDSNDACVCDPGYSGTDCATAACTTGTYCGSGATKECCGTDEVCTTSGDVAGTCVKNNSGCTTNASCNDSTKYCKLTGTWQNDCSVITGGTCEALDDGRETSYTDSTDSTKTKTFLISSSTMSRWAADNWCKAHGMKLVSYNTVNSLFDCDKDKYSCTWDKFRNSNYWDNGSLSGDYWTAESYDSCAAWCIYVNRENFRGSLRYSIYALCE